MDDTTEQQAKHRRAWKFNVLLSGLFYWAVLLVCVPTTLYLGFKGLGLALNGIRDWWHYKESIPHPDGLFWMGVFFIAGLGWLFSHFALQDYNSERRFKEFVSRREAEQRHLEEERNRPRTRWEKFWGYVGMVWLALVFGGFILMLLLK